MSWKPERMRSTHLSFSCCNLYSISEQNTTTPLKRLKRYSINTQHQVNNWCIINCFLSYKIISTDSKLLTEIPDSSRFWQVTECFPKMEFQKQSAFEVEFPTQLHVGLIPDLIVCINYDISSAPWMRCQSSHGWTKACNFLLSVYISQWKLPEPTCMLSKMFWLLTLSILSAFFFP